MKINTLTQNILLLFSIAATSLPVSAAWTLIEDFEGDPNAPKYTFTVALGERNIPQFNYPTDPVNPDNTVLWLDPVAYGQLWMNIWVNWPLPEPIVEGSSGTLYYRFYTTQTNSMSPVLGLTDDPVTYNNSGLPLTPTGWACLDAASTTLNDPNFAPYEGWYMPTDATSLKNVWWEVWSFVDNQIDEVTFYVKGPNDTEPQHVPVPDGSGGFYDTALYRNGADTKDLVGFVIGTLAGEPAAPNSGIPIYIDDIYVDANGKNLNSPIGESITRTWAGYEVSSEGFADTGNWLGWLYIPHSSNWVYSYSMTNWLYFEDPGAGNGGWSFIIR